MKISDTVLNGFFVFGAFFLNLGIEFFLSPYIIKHVGIEAFGFLALVNNFIMYLSLITIATNSMSGRFITIHIHRKNHILANEYYSTIFASNIITILIMLFLGSVFVCNLEKFTNIPVTIELDVKILFLCVLFKFFIEILGANFFVSYLVKNKIYLYSRLQIQGNLLKVMIIVSLFNVFPPHISCFGIAVFLTTVYIKIFDFYYMKKLLPKIKFEVKSVSINRFKEVLLSGVWNAITQLGNVMTTGMDLLIVNLYIGPTEMGILSLIKVVPITVNSILANAIRIFMPSLLELYAKGEFELLVKKVTEMMRMFSVILSIPLIVFFSYGDVLFFLWIPGQDHMQLYKLSNIALIATAVIGPAAIIHTVFMIINKISMNSILIIISGFLNFIIIIVALKMINLGLTAVVVTGTVLSLFRNLLYTIPYGGLYLNENWREFFPIVIKSGGIIFIVSIIGIAVKENFSIIDWMDFARVSFYVILINLFFQYIIILTKDDKIKIRFIINKFLLRERRG